ncbi:MAG: NAD(P)-dependent glycerol-3-phosphate dehydrogenase [Burkholderiaceae bacterium]|nr:MAG: NAD(P)-dependent glycerol-3-phosphate dehydrogenase [Burkholderiaceae bacterium]
MNIAILGAGAWGSALAKSLCEAPQGHRVLLWGRDPALMATLAHTRSNARYLPDITLPTTLQFTADWRAAMAHAAGADALVIVATSVAGLRPTLQRLSTATEAGIIWLCKGLEEGSRLLPHQIAEQVLGTRSRIGALSGPSFAEEVAQGLPVALTLVTRDAAFAEAAVTALHGPRLRIYATDDVVGVEIGGAVKNILAIATGIVEGIGLGLNSRAAVITRGLAEVMRFGAALGARPQTFMGLSGVGDLILTCTGALSRNRKVGLLLAEGKSLSDILAQLGHVAEGVHCAQSVQQLAQQHGVDMPIVNAVCRVLFDGIAPAAAIQGLLARDPAQEVGSRI